MEPEARRPSAKVRRSISARRGAPCGHADAHEFYSFRTYDEALQQRDIMAKAPELARMAISEVAQGRPAGWTWTVCPRCAEPDQRRGLHPDVVVSDTG